MVNWTLRILETVPELEAVEELQRIVWPGSDTDIVPAHLLVTAAHHGGLIIGAYLNSPQSEHANQLVGFVFSFVGLHPAGEGGLSLKHCSHILAVHPDFRDQGLGFALKRAQWQMVRHQGIKQITWTYDPLLSRNAYLNITRLGAVCNTYLREYYGEMRDGLNIGLPSDPFQVDWWLNSHRVHSRLSRRARHKLDLAHFLEAGAEVINTPVTEKNGLLSPKDVNFSSITARDFPKVVLVEIPSDFQKLKAENLSIARDWRFHTRQLFEFLFTTGYLVTDFIFLPGSYPRSYYALIHAESTLSEVIE
jgi:predicted GNAT superfamily acetyltransferase